VAIDFVGPLPKDDRFDTIISMTDRLGADIQLSACRSDMSAEDFAYVFFDKWYCENGCPLEIISDWDKLFILKFWWALMKLMGIQHKLSMAYHPQTDGSLERTNKTVIQCLRFHIKHNQKGWVKALPKVHFDIMNTNNASTGLLPFMLKTGRSPRLLPPLISTAPVPDSAIDSTTAQQFMEEMEEQTNTVKDCLLAAKVRQAHEANKDRNADPAYKVGDKVLLATAHQQRDYIQAKDGHVAKFMPCFDGLYNVLRAYPESSLYTLQLPASSKAHPMFHVSHLQTHILNDDELFPARAHHPPQLLVTVNGTTEYFIDQILDRRPRSRGHQYLVQWMGYRPEHDLWLPKSELIDTEALAKWEAENRS
jgi:hypothetical protein